MWKLLPVVLLVACAANDQHSTSGEIQSTQGRAVRHVELPVVLARQAAGDQPSRKTFERQGTAGWLDQTGGWHIRREVHHGRLRCATYETGIQLGRGDPACANVEWLTGVEYATRHRHCNSASRLHAGGGQLADGASRFADTSCVRVVVRCEGAC
jgi:hypothetical protein